MAICSGSNISRAYSYRGCETDITASDITASDITASDITASDITASDITAFDITASRTWRIVTTFTPAASIARAQRSSIASS
jgi:hypothetical protein